MSELPPRVLIVDNDASLLMAIATRLESIGCRCVKAQSGAQGLAELRHHDIDLLITDLNMPVGDGISLATTFRRESAAPIVVMTGFIGNFAGALETIDNITVIEKPFETHQLVNTIHDVLSRTVQV